MANLFEYPGDHPAQLTAAATRLDVAGVRIERLTDALRLSRSALRSAWETTAADLADQDVGTLVEGLPTVGSSLDKAQTALTTHADALTRIRTEIDTLAAEYRKQGLLYEEAAARYRSYSGRSDGAAEAGRMQANLEARAAVAAQDVALDAYQLKVSEANTSAQTCADALTTAWDPQGKSRSACLMNPGSELLGQGGISMDSLHLLGLQEDVEQAMEAAQTILAADVTNSDSAAYKQAVATLAEIWSHNGENSLFAEQFYAELGATDAVDLFATVATSIQPNSFYDPDESLPITPDLLHGLQTDMANGLALATRDLEMTSDGQLVDVASGGLGVQWMRDLLDAGRNDVSVPWGIHPELTVKGYVPLMATVANGSGFSSGFLQAVGDNMAQMEAEASASGGNGEYVWQTDIDIPVKWNWATGDYDWPRGSDPFTSWTTAMAASPAASAVVLADDKNLLNHVLNVRTWTIRDSGEDSGPSTFWYRFVDDDELLPGLANLGNLLPVMVGPAGTVEGDAGFANIIDLLGNREYNWRIDEGSFEGTDYIPPEMRPGMGDLLTLHIPSVHEALANSETTDAYSRVIADVAKSEAVDAQGRTLADRLMTAEASMIDFLQDDGTYTAADADAQARLAATIAHGHNASNIGLQLAADAAHNAQVQGVADMVKLAVDTTSTPLRWTKEAYKLFIGKDLVTAIAGEFMVDNSAPARNDAADWTGSFRDQLDDTAANQAYQVEYDDLPTPPSTVDLVGADGDRLRWSELDHTAQDWIVSNWPDSAGPPPDEVGSAAVDTFEARIAYLKSVGITFADGT